MQLRSDTLLIATKNQGKLKEFRNCFEPLNIKVQGLFDYAGLPEIIEDGETFAINAMKKAKTIAEHLEMPVLADDSGLCVDALSGNPGVYSARYAGEEATDEMNNNKLLYELMKISIKTENDCLSKAQFVCALAVYDPISGQSLHVDGACPGYITAAPRGENGFGYDPLFFLPQYGKTMAEISVELKNQISHRGAALRKLLSLLSH